MSIIYCEKHDLKWDSDFKPECPACENEAETAQEHRERIEKTHGSLSPEMMAHLQSAWREGAIEHGAVVTGKRHYQECPICGTELGGNIPHVHTFP